MCYMIRAKSKKPAICFINQQSCPLLPQQPSKCISFSVGKFHWHCGPIEMKLGNIFLISFLVLMAFEEAAAHDNCALARVFHWKDSRSQYKSSSSVNKNQFASRSRIASITLNTASFSMPRPSCCTFCLSWPCRWSGL